MDKELLKKFLFLNYLGLVKSYDNEIESKEEFVFEMSEDGKQIIFHAIIKSCYGNSAWDDEDGSKCETKEKTESINNLDEYHFNEAIKSLILTEKEFTDLDLKDGNKIANYYDGLTKQFYYDNEEERVNEDYYFNHDVVRMMRIPIDEIAEFLLNFEFTLPLENIINNLDYILEYIDLNDQKAKDLLIEFNAYKLNLSLPLKNEVKTKNKI